ncbi:hypothetical protein [Micromonospora matsumotoense]|uniref:hypothetical protein n=1 Tax=Micromonospora matsumotoense TaxID=121616 RepID=UPI0033CF84B9
MAVRQAQVPARVVGHPEVQQAACLGVPQPQLPALSQATLEQADGVVEMLGRLLQAVHGQSGHGDDLQLGRTSPA